MLGWSISSTFLSSLLNRRITTMEVAAAAKVDRIASLLTDPVPPSRIP